MPIRYYHRTQQYSITALTDSNGTIKERYAYTAYGTPTITDAIGTVRSSTAEGNRYTYTSREWDEDVEIYRYRARMYDPLTGRFLSRDPIGYDGSPWNQYAYVHGRPLIETDPSGRSIWIDMEDEANRMWIWCGGQRHRRRGNQGCCGGKLYSKTNYRCVNKQIVPKNPPPPSPPLCGYFCTRAGFGFNYFMCIGLGSAAERIVYVYIYNVDCIAFRVISCDEFEAAKTDRQTI